MVVATTMNVKDVACMKPAATASTPDGPHVQQSRQPPDRQQRDQEDRHVNDRAGAVEQRGNAEAYASAHEEHRDQEPEADRFQLSLELLLGGRRLVGPAHDDPGQKCPQDRSQPEVLGHHREGQRERDGQPDPQLGACVLQPLHHFPQRTPSPDPLGHHHNCRGKADEPREQSQLRRRVRRRSREKHRQQDKRSEFRQRTRGHDQTTEVGPGLVRIVEDGHQDPERRRHQRDSHQQAIPDLAAQPEPVGEQESQHRGKDESPADENQDPAVEPPQVDLEARHKQQETQAQVRCHPDSHVEMHPPQDRRSDQDPAEALQHHRWHLQSRD